ncbi:hypothetical protein [Lysobacter gummosus]
MHIVEASTSRGADARRRHPPSRVRSSDVLMPQHSELPLALALL